MNPINFCKFHGFGNDYIVIERDKLDESVSLESLAVNMCHRKTGVGGDGIAVLENRDGSTADYFCEIVNPDGSIAGFSGNGTRCAVAYLHHRGIWTERLLRLETRSGIKLYELLEIKGKTEFWFKAEIGKPRFSNIEIPVLTDTRRDAVVNEPIDIDGEPYLFSAVNIGNPIACIFVDNFGIEWREIGRAMETHEIFPDRANIVWVKVQDRENIEIRIWERGAGETSASGTCSSGAAVLSSFLLKTGRQVNVHSEGGVTGIFWREDDEILIKGRADFAFSGEWPG
ncbi:MAG: diaminopimelate epimerase [Pyrinomonadaceae bacterium]